MKEKALRLQYILINKMVAYFKIINIIFDS